MFHVRTNALLWTVKPNLLLNNRESILAREGSHHPWNQFQFLGCWTIFTSSFLINPHYYEKSSYLGFYNRKWLGEFVTCTTTFSQRINYSCTVLTWPFLKYLFCKLLQIDLQISRDSTLKKFPHSLSWILVIHQSWKSLHCSEKYTLTSNALAEAYITLTVPQQGIFQLMWTPRRHETKPGLPPCQYVQKKADRGVSRY